jgi:hypothetical protein
MSHRELEVTIHTTMAQVFAFIDQPVECVFYPEFLDTSAYGVERVVRLHSMQPKDVPTGCLWSYSGVSMETLWDMFDFVKGRR